MADETDFLDLYRKLHLDPGCTLAEFKQAYRRQVARWHPDRRRGTRADELAAARLQRLTVQFGAAMHFHKRHGRLPGAALPSRATVIVPEPALVVDDGGPAVTVTVGGEATPQRALSTRWLLLVAMIGVAVIGWSLMPAAHAPAEDDTSGTPGMLPGVPARSAASPTLDLGMTPDNVLAIEGEPTRRGDDQWEYGPSWVRFERGGISDWYSSPLRGLHVDTPRGHH